jgi:hypothetical protein
MAKGDHSRAQNKIDEQQKLAQGYLTGVQQQAGNMYGNLNNLYWGGTDQQYGSSYGAGTTVPQYSSTNTPSFSGNGTDTPYAGQDYESQFNQLFPGDTLTSDMLIQNEQKLSDMGMRLMGPNASGQRTKLMLPSGQSVDVVGGAGAGHNRRQWLEQGGVGGGSIPGMAMQEHAGLQGMYGDTYGDFHGMYGDIPGMFGGYLGAAQNMAETGGLSEADKGNLRARAISPIRSVYSQGVQNLDRQRALQGGYSPGYGTLLGRFNREQGQLTSDATTNAEAAIAEMVQRGKLGGLSAWGSGLGQESNAMLGALGGQLGSARGATDLYGTQPGMAKLFGDQAMQAMGMQMDAARLQNQLSLGTMGAQIDSSKIPGNFQSAMDNVKGAMDAAKGVAGAGAPITDWWEKRRNRPGFEKNIPQTEGGYYGEPVGYNPGMEEYMNAGGNGPIGGPGYYGTPYSGYNPDMDPSNWSAGSDSYSYGDPYIPGTYYDPSQVNL